MKRSAISLSEKITYEVRSEVEDDDCFVARRWKDSAQLQIAQKEVRKLCQVALSRLQGVD